jgi:hypothetical protein
MTIERFFRIAGRFLFVRNPAAGFTVDAEALKQAWPGDGLLAAMEETLYRDITRDGLKIGRGNFLLFGHTQADVPPHLREIQKIGGKAFYAPMPAGKRGICHVIVNLMHDGTFHPEVLSVMDTPAGKALLHSREYLHDIFCGLHELMHFVDRWIDASVLWRMQGYLRGCVPRKLMSGLIREAENVADAAAMMKMADMIGADKMEPYVTAMTWFRAARVFRRQDYEHGSFDVLPLALQWYRKERAEGRIHAGHLTTRQAVRLAQRHLREIDQHSVTMAIHVLGHAYSLKSLYDATRKDAAPESKWQDACETFKGLAPAVLTQIVQKAQQIASLSRTFGTAGEAEFFDFAADYYTRVRDQVASPKRALWPRRRSSPPPLLHLRAA